MDEQEQKRLREEEELVGVGCFMFLIAAALLAGFVAACGG